MTDRADGGFNTNLLTARLSSQIPLYVSMSANVERHLGDYHGRHELESAGRVRRKHEPHTHHTTMLVRATVSTMSMVRSASNCFHHMLLNDVAVCSYTNFYEWRGAYP